MLFSMLCWGSWANTQKIDNQWRFELFYWDYMWGLLACALLFGLIAGGTNPASPDSFFRNLSTSSARNVLEAFVGGVIFFGVLRIAPLGSDAAQYTASIGKGVDAEALAGATRLVNSAAAYPPLSPP
jgi:glucose uptake protein